MALCLLYAMVRPCFQKPISIALTC
jgi:hypothetical protein